MKKTNLDKIKTELEKGFGLRHMRYGIEYAWYNASALDEGIRTRARQARKWREKVLELAQLGTVYEQRVRLRNKYARLKYFNATAYVVDGTTQFYVYRAKIFLTDYYEEIN